MSTKSNQENDEESAILLLEDHEENDKNEENIDSDEDDEMLLLSSSPSSDEGKRKIAPKAGPSGVKKSRAVDNKPSNIVIEDSDSEELESSENSNSVEVIGSEDEEDDEEIEDSDSCESLTSLLDGKVRIFMSHGSFFIWDVEDVQMLREECRIMGKLVGCLPRAPRQNNQLGMPLQLMPEEAKLLEDIEAACVVEEVEAADDLALMRKATFEAVRKENYKAQQIMYKESRREEVLQHKHEIIEGKKAKKRKIQLEGSKGKVESAKKAKLAEEKSSNVEAEKTEECEKDMSSDSLTNTGDDKSKETDGNESESVRKSKSDLKSKDKMENDKSGNDEGNSADLVANVKGSSNESQKEDTEKDSGKTDEEKNLSLSDVEDNEQNSEKPSLEDQKTVVGEETHTSGAEVSDVDDVEEKDDDVKEDSCVVISHEDEEEEEEEEEFNVDDIVTSETHVKHSLVQIFTENPWTETLRKPKHWIFPLSQKEYLRYEVFRDLWKKGYFLTSGSKFGGDFLVYPGDPARYHSHFIAVCIDKTVDLSALDIISLGRLGSNVRKTVLLCAFNKEKKIEYTSLQWTGIT